jgi:small-conductance mechanosensitive channel
LVRLADSSVVVEVEVWIANAEDEEDMSAAVVEASKLALDAAGVEVPYPHRQLLVDAGVREKVRKLKAS